MYIIVDTLGHQVGKLFKTYRDAVTQLCVYSGSSYSIVEKRSNN